VPYSSLPAPAKPLAGLRVLELARILAGPWAGQILADLGAEVIKVERAGPGDDTRGWGPPFVEATDGGNLGAAYFHACNRGKQSIAIDFERPEQLARVRRLAEQADVVIENFKVGGLKRFGLDHASLSRRNPRLITCSITGFGQDGPYAERAGYDFLIQGMAGPMSISGEPDGRPLKTGYATADLSTGLYATIGILGALIARNTTGKGTHVDCSLLDSQVALLGNQALNYLVSGKVPGRLGNGHPNIVPYDVFPVADGDVIIAVGNDAQYARLCDLLGLPQKPEFTANADRVRARHAVNAAVAGATAGWRKLELLAKLEELGIPGGPINDIAEVFADPQVAWRELRLDVPNAAAAAGSVPGLRLPILLDGMKLVAETGAPALGGAGNSGWNQDEDHAAA